jgi:hypothetical protein
LICLYIRVHLKPLFGTPTGLQVLSQLSHHTSEASDRDQSVENMTDKECSEFGGAGLCEQDIVDHFVYYVVVL